MGIYDLKINFDNKELNKFIEVLQFTTDKYF